VGRMRVRYLVTKPRKGGLAYYWQPNRALIAAGFATERLPNTLPAAIARAEEINATVDAYHADGRQPGALGPRAWSLEALSDAFQMHHSFARLSERSRRDFAYAIRPAIETMGDLLVRDLSRMAIMAWVTRLVETHGPANARNTGAAFRRLMAFGHDQGWVTVNNATKLDLPTPASRARVWTLDERDRFIAAAAAAGHPSMGLAVMLGWCLGQRPADLRTLTWAAYDGSAVALRQRKTGTSIWVPAMPELRRALDATKRQAVQVVVSEATGRPYQEGAFQHEFARIRAAAGLPGDLQFRDLRRTLATALGAAGCTDDQIRAITGHQTREVVAVYVRPDRTFAEGAMKRLEGAKRALSRTDFRRAVGRKLDAPPKKA
jgi:integrase